MYAATRTIGLRCKHTPAQLALLIWIVNRLQLPEHTFLSTLLFILLLPPRRTFPSLMEASACPPPHSKVTLASMYTSLWHLISKLNFKQTTVCLVRTALPDRYEYNLAHPQSSRQRITYVSLDHTTKTAHWDNQMDRPVRSNRVGQKIDRPVPFSFTMSLHFFQELTLRLKS